ncbi:hypothetical protein, partial [Corallococcus sp. AB038B]
MSTNFFRARPGGVLLAFLLTSSLAGAQAPAPVQEEEVNACGLEPPGVVYLPAPSPRAHETRKLSATEAPVVRREARDG